MSNVLVVNSSFRKKSNSSLLSAQVASGAESQGHNVESIDIGKLRIEPCRGCMSCMKLKNGTCVIKDDMQPLYEQIKKADILGAVLYMVQPMTKALSPMTLNSWKKPDCSAQHSNRFNQQ